MISIEENEKEDKRRQQLTTHTKSACRSERAPQSTKTLSNRATIAKKQEGTHCFVFVFVFYKKNNRRHSCVGHQIIRNSYQSANNSSKPTTAASTLPQPTVAEQKKKKEKERCRKEHTMYRKGKRGGVTRNKRKKKKAERRQEMATRSHDTFCHCTARHS